MSNIEENLGFILSSRYGKDVRQAIHDAIHDCYEDGKAGATDLIAREQIADTDKKLSAQIANLVANAPSGSEKDSELVDIRVGYEGTRYTSAGEAVRGQISSLKEDLGELNNLITSNIITSISTIKGNVSYDRLTGRLNVNVDETTGEARFFIDFDKNGLEKVYTHIDGFSNVQKTNPIFSYAWTNGADNIGTGNIYIDGIYEVDLSRFTGTRRYFLVVGENINCTLFITDNNADVEVNELYELNKRIENNEDSLNLFNDSFSIERLTPNIIKNGILYPSGLFVETSTHNTFVYYVSPNSKVYIKAKKTDFKGVLYATYQFQKVSSVSNVSIDNVVGETVTGDVNSIVTVPDGAYYLLISVKVDDKESGMYSQPIHSQMEKVFRFSNTTIMPCFDNELKLNIMVSNNHGKSFETYQRYLFSDENGGTIRDPSIVRFKGQYVIAYSRHGTSVGNTFGLCVSDDLMHWYSKPNVIVDGMSYVWAPELFVDDGILYCIVALSSTKTSDLSLYMLSTSDLINWTIPVIMDFDTNLTDTCYDGFIIKADGKYNLLYKDSTYPPSSIVLAQSDTLNGHYTVVDTNIKNALKDTTDDYGTSGYFEGVSVIELPNGKFRMFVDNYAREKYYYLDSSDLVTWSTKEEIVSDNKIRHGTAFNFNN